LWLFRLRLSHTLQFPRLGDLLVFGLLHFRKREINWPVLAGWCKPVKAETNTGGIAIRSLLDCLVDDRVSLAGPGDYLANEDKRPDEKHHNQAGPNK
jgi:hypothetical protein